MIFRVFLATGVAFAFGSAFSQSIFCPTGSVYDSSYHVCVQGNMVLGPFPLAMQKRCRDQYSEEQCSLDKMSFPIFKTLKKEKCYIGTSFHDIHGYCEGEDSLFGPFLKVDVEECEEKGGGDVCYTNRWSSKILDRYKSLSPACADGYSLDFQYKLCINDEASIAMGPFSKKMIEECVIWSDGDPTKSCLGNTWDASFAKDIRKTDICPLGAIYDSQLQICKEESSVFGPFSLKDIRKCMIIGGKEDCWGYRWHESFAPTSPIPRFENGQKVHICETYPKAVLRSGPGKEFSYIEDVLSKSNLVIENYELGWYMVLWGNKRGFVDGNYLCQEHSEDPQPSENEIISFGKKFIGFSYWWGGAALKEGGQKGSCWKINGANSYNGHSGPYGADCSGYVSKVWQLPEAMPLESNKHPFSTFDFVKSNRRWSMINRNDTKMGDAMVYNTGGAGHIVIYEKGDFWGQASALEARGCSYGIVHNVRALSQSYKTRRKN